MVPKGWHKHQLSAICTLQNGHSFKPHEWDTEGLPIIRIQNLNGSTNFNYYAGEADDRWIVETGQLLFSWAGTRGVSFGPFIWSGSKGVLNQHIYKVYPKRVDAAWLYLTLKWITHHIEAQAHGFKATLLHVQKKDIEEQYVLVPPFPEQRKIAQILSTWDKAIATTERLLANKQQQKKALMQRLLTGRQRFAGFEGEWVSYCLGDISNPKQWPTISSSELLDNGYEVYGANGLIGYYSEYNHEFETVAVTCRGSTCGEVSLIPSKSYITGNAMCLDDIDENKVSYKYLYYILSFRGFRDIISGSAQPQIVGAAIRNLKIELPSSLIEQNKIADLLITCDKEITSISTYISNATLQKKALMQQLLTGKRRVKVDEAAA